MSGNRDDLFRGDDKGCRNYEEDVGLSTEYGVSWQVCRCRFDRKRVRSK